MVKWIWLEIAKYPDKMFTIQFIPSYCDVIGKEKPDANARLGCTSEEVMEVKINNSDLLHKIKRSTMEL